MNQIVCYTGGTCGDLITAMIDPANAVITSASVYHDTNRSKLKKSHLFNSDEDKDEYLANIFLQYHSIPSHDLPYHLSRKHNFISIVVTDFDVAIWAASRFKSLHRPQVWDEMQQTCNAKTVNDYAQTLIDYSIMVANHTKQVLSLESIINGTVEPQLEEYLQRPLDQDGKHFYQQWLKLQII